MVVMYTLILRTNRVLGIKKNNKSEKPVGFEVLLEKNAQQDSRCHHEHEESKERMPSIASKKNSNASKTVAVITSEKTRNSTRNTKSKVLATPSNRRVDEHTATSRLRYAGPLAAPLQSEGIRAH